MVAELFWSTYLDTSIGGYGPSLLVKLLKPSNSHVSQLEFQFVEYLSAMVPLSSELFHKSIFINDVLWVI